MRLFDLSGRTALVTGAGRGIGRASALALAEAGSAVVVSDIDLSAAQAVVDEIRVLGADAVAVRCDVGKDDDLTVLVQSALGRYGRIDTLVCNAGVQPCTGPIGEATDEAFSRTMDVNVKSTWRLTSLVTPGMAEHHDGSIIIISSVAGIRGNKALGVYSISKAANASLARNLAVEFGPYNVRANAISPGVIDTEFARPLTDNAAYTARRVALTPLRRLGTPDDVAGAVVYLASPAGSFVSGHNLVIDGGTLVGDGS